MIMLLALFISVIMAQNATPVRVPVLDTGVKLLARGLRDTGDFVYRYVNVNISFGLCK
jgi:hypothetical protein